MGTAHRVVLVSGEAGAGKTRLIGEFAHDVAGSATVLWGRCSPDRLGAYEPFVEPVRTALRLDIPKGALVGELQRIVPELAPDPGSAPGLTTAAPGVERRRCFDAVVELVAGIGRCLLVVDDVQWADEGSLALLAHLVASTALTELTIVAAIRATDIDASTASALGDLRRRASHRGSPWPASATTTCTRWCAPWRAPTSRPSSPPPSRPRPRGTRSSWPSSPSISSPSSGSPRIPRHPPRCRCRRASRRR